MTGTLTQAPMTAARLRTFADTRIHKLAADRQDFVASLPTSS